MLALDLLHSYLAEIMPNYPLDVYSKAKNNSRMNDEIGTRNFPNILDTL